MKKFKCICESITYLIIFSVTIIATAFITSLIYILFGYFNISLPTISPDLLEIIACLLMILIFFLLFKRKKISFRSSIHLKKIKPISMLMFILCGISLLFICTVVLSYLIHFFDFKGYASNVTTESLAGVNLLWFFLAKSVAAPIGEEITFRGLIYPKLKKGYSKAFSSFLSSLIFGLLHLSSAVYTVITAFLLGVLNNYLSEKYNSILPGILIHSGFNFMSAFGQLYFRNLGASEVPINITLFIILIISTIYIVLDIRKIKKVDII